MWNNIKAFFASVGAFLQALVPKLKSAFLYSETIFLARLQAFVGVVLGVFLSLDPSLFQGYVPPKWVPIYLLAVGVLGEYARRRNDPTLGQKGP